MTAPYQALAGVIAFVLLAGLRTATANRLIRRKLGLSMLLVAGFVLFGVAYAIAPIDAETHKKAELVERLASLGKVLLAFASINAIVALLLNPFRADRVPELFPTIVQDAVIIGLFLLVGAVFMEEKWLTLSAVGGFVIGFALQDTLGNMFAGLAIQVEKPFRVGHWISVAGYEGSVTEITWRATRLRTKTGNLIVVPNNVLSKEAISNYSEPSSATRLFVDVGVTYDAPPNEVKAVLAEAVADLNLPMKTPSPEIVVADFGSSAIVYRVKFWIADFSTDDRARDQVRTAIYYALKRRGIEIPYPTQMELQREQPPARSEERQRELNRLVASPDVFAPLSDKERADLAASSSEQLFGAGETIVRQGQAGDSMFVICRGTVRVVLEGGQEVARIGTGGYFGEMSLLTGEPRSATVVAVDDVIVLEIKADSIRHLGVVHPAVIEQISLEVAARREGLERSREVAAVATVAPEAHRSFLSRVQDFLGIGFGQ